MDASEEEAIQNASKELEETDDPEVCNLHDHLLSVKKIKRKLTAISIAELLYRMHLLVMRSDKCHEMDKVRKVPPSKAKLTKKKGSILIKTDTLACISILKSMFMNFSNTC